MGLQLLRYEPIRSQASKTGKSERMLSRVQMRRDGFPPISLSGEGSPAVSFDAPHIVSPELYGIRPAAAGADVRLTPASQANLGAKARTDQGGAPVPGIRISIARPVAIWPCANITFFAFG